MYAAVLLFITQLARENERGATAVEYALMVTLIVLAIFVVVGVLGTNLAAIFGDQDLTGAFS